MSKGKTPSLLSLNNGGIIFKLAKGLSKCSRCKKDILRGSRFGGLKTFKFGFIKHRRLCIECARAVIVTTQSELDKIKTGL